MTHTTISPLLVQLFEAESRLVDHLLDQNQDWKHLQKPPYLQGRTLPLPLGLKSLGKSASSVNKLCESSLQSHDSVKVEVPKSTQQVVDSLLNEIFSSTTSLHTMEIDEPAVQLTGMSFTAQDPVSAAIDALHADLSNTIEPNHRLLKPKGVLVNVDARLPDGGLLSVPSARLSESASLPVPALLENCVSSSSFTWQKPSTFLSCQEKRNNKTVPRVQTGGCYNLRRKMSLMKDKETTVENSAPKRRRTLSGCRCVSDGAEAAAMTDPPALVPDSGCDVSNKQACKNTRSLRKRSWKITVDADDNDGREKGERGCSASVGGQTQTNTYQDSALTGLSHEKQKGRQVKANPTKCSATMLTARHILKRRKRVVVARSLNLLCVSCKHGFMSTECQICTPTRTDCKRNTTSVKIANKTKILKNGVSLQKTSRAVNNKTSSLKSRKQSSNIECSQKQHLQSTGSRTNSPKFHSKTRHANGMITKCKPIQAKSVQPKPKIKGTNAVFSESKVSRTNSNKSKSQNSTVSAIPTKAKSNSRHTVPSKLKALGTENTLNNILERHKQQSSEIQAALDEDSFSSTKDMFSHLCQLQERSKEYDASTLDTVLPAKQVHGESVYSKPFPPRSTAHQNSHVGGIWKSIFSKK